jgi:leucine dehydrogenase
MAVHILDAMAREGFEELIALSDRPSGLKAFLGIHDSSPGRAFGGIRRFGYRDEKSALLDCLRLSVAMSLKCALAGLPCGGAKLVVLDRPRLPLERLYRKIGEAIERLGGRYFAGPDVGTGARELAWAAEATRHVARPGAPGLGDLSEATVAGVFAGMRAALVARDGDADWSRRTIVVQGMGSVGERVAERLLALGARVLASDVDSRRAATVAARLDVELLPPGTEIDYEGDVFCPCAMGGILHDVTIERLRVRVICGAAHNPLARTRHAERLHERGILYIPDIAANAGAVIRGAEYYAYGKSVPSAEIEERVGALVSRLITAALEERRSPLAVAIDEARGIIEQRRQLDDEAARAHL